MTASTDEPFDDMMSDFLDEASQLVDRLNEDLLVLDELAKTSQPEFGPDQVELLNRMFRSAHSIKGLSAMLGLQNVNRLTHRIESVLDGFRKSEKTVNSAAVEAVFKGVDSLSEMLSKLSSEGNDSVDAKAAMAAIEAVLSCGTRNLNDSIGNVAVATGPNPKARKRNNAPAQATMARVESTMDEIARSVELAIEEEMAISSSDLNAVTAIPSCEEKASVELACVDSEHHPTTIPDPFAELADEEGVPAKYLAIFIDEAYQALDTISDALVSDDVVGNHAACESLMIMSHRIKGSAASVGLHRCAKLAHLMEDEVQERRDAGNGLSFELIDPLLKCTDALRQYVDSLKVGASDTTTFAAAAHELKLACEKPEKSPTQPPPTPQSQTDWVRALATYAFSGQRYVGGRIVFEPNLPLVGLKAQLLFEKLIRVGDVAHCEPPPGTIESLEVLESFVFLLCTHENPDSVRKLLMISGVRSIEVQTIEAATPTGGEPPCEAGVATTLLSDSAPSGGPKPNDVSKAEARQTPAIVDPPRAAKQKIPETPPAERNSSEKNGAEKHGDQSRPNETLRVDIERLDQLMNLAGQLVINKARISKIGEQIREATPAKKVASLVRGISDGATRLGAEIDRPDTLEAALARLETSQNLARRLSADFEVVRSELERVAKMHASLSDLFEAVHQLDRVTDGIQKSVMNTRMVPIGPLFTRFKRVIRDITRANGKEIQLHVHGEKTELDKRMIDELGDPLIHMIRNAADHGIETPEARVAAGKAPEGAITLDAFHRGNSIVIRVSDDGRGLDRKKILAKALERKLVSPGEEDRLSDEDVLKLIWEPGFSTAEKVTEISGRGVGMDIVRSKIEGINGVVEVSSEPGKGTTFTIRLPLTLAILPSLMARIEGDTFALPIESIIEIVRLDPDDVSTIHGIPTAVIRGRVISIIELSNVLLWNRPPSCPTDREGRDRVLVIFGHERREVGLVVDQVLGEEDVVIKSLAEHFRNVVGVAGASIMGDGSVALILDTAALLDLSATAYTTLFRKN